MKGIFVISKPTLAVQQTVEIPPVQLTQSLPKQSSRFRFHKTIAKMAAPNDLQQALKPFYQRASEAEDRLARLEAALASKQDAGNEELLKMVSELQSKLEAVKAEHVSEKQKASEEVKKLRVENEKLQYRITHLVRALKEADSKSASQ